MKVDFHLHTNASDGRLSPEEMIQTAARLGLEIIAITDHDSVEAIVPALAMAQAFPSLKVVPGVEVSADIPREEVHILGYFIDYQSPSLNHVLRDLRGSRKRRAQRMIANLAKLGVHIEWGRVLELANEASVGRPHLARAMLERGYISSLPEAFAKYIGRNGPAYAEREKLSPVEAVELVRKAKGLPVLAHPAELERPEAIIHELKRGGLLGIEVFYNGYSPETVERLLKLAREHDLIPCGGSDFHGLEKGDDKGLGSVDIPSMYIEQLFALAKQKGMVLT